MINIKTKEEFSEIIKKRVLVDFYANWCGPCKILSPELEKITDIIDVAKVNVDELNDLAREYGIMSIPCIILFENSNEVKRNIGFIPEAKLKEFINK